MSSSPDHANEAGAAIGAVLVFGKEITSEIVNSGLVHISWTDVWNASVLAAVGATVGFLTTALLKRLRPVVHRQLKRLYNQIF